MSRQKKDWIVVADDDQGILESFDAMLGDDYNIKMVNNGLDACNELVKDGISLMFLDIKMPLLNGLDVLEWIKSSDVDTEVVVITAMPQEDFKEMAEAYGVYRYLSKPFDVDEVQGIVSDIVH